MARPVIICFAGDIWDGNPHSRHHLMRRFARGSWDVLFVEGVPMRSVSSGDAYEFRRIVAKLRARPGLRTVEENLHVLRPLPIPPSGQVGRMAQIAVLRAQIAWARRRLDLVGPVISWFSLPVAAPLAGHLGERGSILYYNDRYHEFGGVDVEYLRSCLRTLAQRCEVTMATAEELSDDLRSLGANPETSRHGVDVDHFATAPPPPPDLAPYERPLVGCVGLLDDHLDFDAMNTIADGLDRGTVVHVGAINTDPSAITHPRVKLIRHRPYVTIPAYVHAFDVCLVPFGQKGITHNPIKLREYLAAGRPVVATDMPEVRPYADVVTLVSEGDDWSSAVANALGDDGEPSRRRRRDRVAHESWDHVAAKVERRLWPLLGDDAPAGADALRRPGVS